MVKSGFYHVLADGRIEFQVSCGCCATPYTFIVPLMQFEAWQDGVFVQDAFPSMPAMWREMLVSSTCPSCFAKLFPPDEEWVDE